MYNHSRRNNDESESASRNTDGLERTVVTTAQEPQKQGLIERLSSAFRFDKDVETRSRRPSFGVRHAGAERIKPSKNLKEYRELFETTPIVRKSLTDFGSDVVEPGYRVETENEDVQEYLEDVWCPQAAVVGGEKHNDLLPFLRQFVIERWRGGDALASHVRADYEDSDSLFTGLHLINPENVEFVTYEEQNILVDPDDDSIDVPQTKRDENGAYIQYGNKALVSTDRREIPLSQNDLTRSALDAGAGELRGTPVTETIAEDVAGYKNIRRDMEKAIETKAWGLWDIGFGRDILEYTDVGEDGKETEITEIIEWSQEDQNEYVDEHLQDIKPGAILTHDGEISLNRIEGEVPDLIEDLEHYVSEIVSVLPTPLYIIGFETNINQFVTERQDERYQRLINEERQELERIFTDVMQRVVEKNLVENSHTDVSVSEVPEDLTFKVEPAEEESPIMSLDSETIERMKTWAEAFSQLRGDVPADMFADQNSLLELILQLPDDAQPEDLDEGFLDESDPDFQRAAEEMGLFAEMEDDEGPEQGIEADD